MEHEAEQFTLLFHFVSQCEMKYRKEGFVSLILFTFNLSISVLKKKYEKLELCQEMKMLTSHDSVTDLRMQATGEAGLLHQVERRMPQA